MVADADRVRQASVVTVAAIHAAVAFGHQRRWVAAIRAAVVFVHRCRLGMQHSSEAPPSAMVTVAVASAVHPFSGEERD